MALTLIQELEALGKGVKKAQGTKFSPEYFAYLESSHWQERRRRIKPKRCAGCGSTNRLELNHVCYPPRGASLQAFIDQSDDDFAWLCHPCHRAVTLSVRKRRSGKKKK